jgi:hypothetical protein
MMIPLHSVAAANCRWSYDDTLCRGWVRRIAKLGYPSGTLRYAAASHALASRLIEARQAVARLRRIDPLLRVSILKS